MGSSVKKSDGGCRAASPSPSSRDELVEAWKRDYGKAPPKRTSNRLLTLSAAYHEQVAKHGPLSRRAASELEHWGRTDGKPTAGRDAKKPKQKLTTGTRLIREWNGKEHIVDVVEDGFLFEGETYGSLSKIARAITGAHWSGPRFFGVTKS